MKVSTHKGRENANSEVNVGEMGKKLANKKANELDRTCLSKSC